MSEMKILVIEDEPQLAALLKKGLEENGYKADVVFDGDQGRRHVEKNDYALILLDVLIPYVNGIMLCRHIRQIKPHLPILMLTALGATEDKMEGFKAGADDYLVKPFEFWELLARIKSLTRRTTGVMETTSTIKVADLELDLDRKIAKRGEQSIELTAKEFLLLEFLMRNKNRVVSKNTIMEKVWGMDFDTRTNAVEVYINFLRKKIDFDFDTPLIHTKIGMGYYFGER